MKSRCTLTNKRHVERMETKSCTLFTSYGRQNVYFSGPGATFSSVRLFPTVVVLVVFGQSVV